MAESYRFSKRDFGSRSMDDADLAFLRKKFPTRFVVKAFRDHESPYDQGLTQYFEPADARAFKAAKAYAIELCADRTAVAAEVNVEVEFPSYFHVRGRDVGGWHVAITDAFRAEAGPSEVELVEEELRRARRDGPASAIMPLERRLRELTGRAW